MVIGNGVIGKAFKAYGETDDVLIFASGVSNSQTNKESEYTRERQVLKQVLDSNPGKKLVYFSSCSIHSKTSKPSRYIDHKIEIEDYIAANVKHFLIIRLPNIVGFSSNPYQLTNFFFDKLTKQELIHVDLTAKRFLIDVDDIPPIVYKLLGSINGNRVFDVAFDNGVSICELMNIFETIWGTSFIFQEVPPYPEYTVDNGCFLEIMKTSGGINKYNTNADAIIKKYYSKR